MTMRVMSRPGRITQPGHVMTIVRNVVSPEAVSAIGRVRMLEDRKDKTQASNLLAHPAYVYPAVFAQNCLVQNLPYRAATDQ